MSEHQLVAWVGQRCVGYLNYDDEYNLYSFAYDPKWLKSADAFPISPALPLVANIEISKELHSATVRKFFENLLPEGQALEDVSQIHQVSKANLYGLLNVLGRESTGALCLLPEGQLPEKIAESKREITYAELSERIVDRAHRPFHVWDGRVRMSIAGFQDKLPVYIEDDHLYLVEGRLASTHILKPEPFTSRLSHLVANEYFCLCLAASLGVASAPVSLLRVPEPVLCIERFDRRRSQQDIKRLHVVDSCQALDLSVSYKYERNFGGGRDVKDIREGVSMKKLFSVSSAAISQAKTQMKLLRWILVQYIIGNSDAHGKNISFIVEPGGLRLAPAYDLVAVCIYPDIDHELAMAIGDEFHLSKIRAFDWADFAEQCGLNRQLLSREMIKMSQQLKIVLPKLQAWPGYNKNEQKLIQKISQFCLQQADRLEKDAKLLPGVVLD